MNRNNLGQGAIEYILLIVIIILALIALLAPGGILTRGVDHSIEQAVDGIEGILDNTW